jgi:hypothetical protein
MLEGEWLMDRCTGRICLVDLPARRLLTMGASPRKQDYLPSHRQILPLHAASISFHGLDAVCILLYHLDIWIRIHSHDLVSGTQRRDATEECYLVITL